MIKLSYHLDPDWLVKSRNADAKTYEDEDFILTFFSGEQIFVINDYDCCLYGAQIAVLDFAKTLFVNVLMLNDGESVETYFTLDANESIWVSRNHGEVIASSSVSRGNGRCAYADLLDTSAAYFRKVINDVYLLFPRITDNETFVQRYLNVGLETYEYEAQFGAQFRKN